jgi:heat shock protein HslJ
MKALFTVGGMFFLLAACSSSPMQQQDGAHAALKGKWIASDVYQCGNARVVASITDQEELLLQTHKQEHVLKQTIAASGVRYAGDAAHPELVFWTKGDTAFMESGGNATNCRRLANLLPMQLRGNEPGWHIAFEEDTTRVNLKYGQVKLNLPPAKIERDGRLWRYSTSDGTQTFTAEVEQKLCVDSMSGMSYPLKATIALGEQTYTGCGGTPALLISGVDWKVTDIGGTPAQGDVSLSFNTGDQLAGSSGCNRLTSTYNLTGEDMRIGRIATTRMACAPALMQQESRLTKALENVTQFELNNAGELVLRSAGNQDIRARRSN